MYEQMRVGFLLLYDINLKLIKPEAVNWNLNWGLISQLLQVFALLCFTSMLHGYIHRTIIITKQCENLELNTRASV